MGQHSGRFPASKSRPAEGDARPQHCERSRRHLPSGMDQQLAGRPRFRLFFLKRPYPLDSPALYRDGNGHHDGEHLGTGTVLRRRETAVSHRLGIVCAGQFPRRTRGAQEQPPAVLHDHEGFPHVLQDAAVLRTGILGHRCHAGETRQQRLRDGGKGQYKADAQHQGGLCQESLRPVVGSLRTLHGIIYRRSLDGKGGRLVLHLLRLVPP